MHPEVVTQLRASHEKWMRSIWPAMEPTRIVIGNDAENPMELTSQDWQTSNADVVWSRGHVEGRKLGNGPWLVDVHQAGRYRFSLSRWPLYTSRPIDSTEARLQIGPVDESSVISDAGVAAAVFNVDLPAGPASLHTWLTTPEGKTHGAYFVVVERQP